MLKLVHDASRPKKRYRRGPRRSLLAQSMPEVTPEAFKQLADALRDYDRMERENLDDDEKKD
jgi:hypothetical protein